MDFQRESPLTAGLVRIYPFCKHLLLQTPWYSGDLTGTQRMVLLTSLVSGRMTMTQLAEAIVCSKEQVSRAVSPLVSKGLLQRSFDPKNRTRVYIQLTDQGRLQIHQQLEQCTAALHDRFAALSKEKQENLTQAFTTVYEFLAQDPLPHAAAPVQQGGTL